MIRFFLCATLLCCAAAAEDAPVLRLTMKRAVDLALAEEGNARLQLAREFVVQARSRATEARSALLPSLDVTAGTQNMTRNLAVLGLTSSTLGFPIPSRVGPLSVTDARTTAGQKLLDLPSLFRYRASKIDVLSSESNVDGTAEEVAARVAQAYLAALRAAARVQAEEANLGLAQSVLSTAKNNQRAGSGSGLEVAQADLRVAQEKQKLLHAANQKRRAELLLRRAIGLRLDVPLELTETLVLPVRPANLDDGPAIALDLRPDWKAQKSREQAAAVSARSAQAERYPTVSAFADYGAVGGSLVSALATHTLGISVQFPLFDGGRRKARADASASQLRQERARTADLRDQIHFEVDTAADQLRSALDEAAVAETALTTAGRTFEQVERRYKSGVASHLDVAEAQTEIARTRDSYLAALYASNEAWVEYHRATGRLRAELESRTQ
jgi:outer membrane protein TolC